MNNVPLKNIVAAVAAAVVVAAAAYGVSRELPKTYQASGTFRVSAANSLGIDDAVVTAANDLATQYAQLASAPFIQSRAARALQVPASSLNGAISATPVSASNLVQVSATGSNAAQAASRAHAALLATVAYIQRMNASQSVAYAKTVNSGLASVNSEIASVTDRLNHDSPNQRQTDLAVLSSLLAQRQTNLSSTIAVATGSQPVLQIVSPGDAAAVTYPKPSLYALIAFIVALLVALRIAFMFGARGRQGEIRRAA